jgi:hypothetical protein
LEEITLLLSDTVHSIAGIAKKNKTRGSRHGFCFNTKK